LLTESPPSELNLIFFPHCTNGALVVKRDGHWLLYSEWIPVWSCTWTQGDCQVKYTTGRGEFVVCSSWRVKSANMATAARLISTWPYSSHPRRNSTCWLFTFKRFVFLFGFFRIILELCFKLEYIYDCVHLNRLNSCIFCIENIGYWFVLITDAFTLAMSEALILRPATEVWPINYLIITGQ
jgi:hypothetical protein